MDSRFAHLPQRAPRPASHAMHQTPFNQRADFTTCSLNGLDRDALFTEFVPLVRRLTRQYGPTSEIRQEMPGELYCRFQTLLDNYDPDRGVPLRPYLVRQLTARAYAFARKQWTQMRRETPLVEDLTTELLQPASDPTREWDAAIQQREEVASLSRLIAQLPERQRRIVAWRYFEDRSFEEIAGLLGVQESSVRSLLRHGMNNLRRRIDLR